VSLTGFFAPMGAALDHAFTHHSDAFVTAGPFTRACEQFDALPADWFYVAAGALLVCLAASDSLSRRQ
jgi:hypothetical protein